MESDSLEQIIRRHVHLPPYANAKGWYPVLHHTCDHGRKGKRAAFKFDNGLVAFHCYNCSVKAVFDPDNVDPDRPIMSKSLVQVLTDFGVPEDEYKQVQFDMMAKRNEGFTPEQKEQAKINIEPAELKIPENFYNLKDADENDKWAMIANIYLEDRNIDPNDYNFMLAKPTHHKHLQKWLGRIILPSYKKGKLIFYQGRDLTGTKIKKYESPPDSRENVMCGFDRLFEDYDKPLYIVEGWFDAEAIEGVAILSNTFSKNQITWLNRTRRPKVYVPDKFKAGKVGAKVAIEQGWSVSTPEIGDHKDVSSAIEQYGKMYVMKTLAEQTTSGFVAETQVGIYCMN